MRVNNFGGLWANLSHLEDDRWVNDACQALRGYNTADGLTTRGGNMTHVFSTLKFGAPLMIRLTDRSIYLVFWCYEENVSIMRWFRFDSPPVRASESSLSSCNA
jgi:sialidase-1